MLRLLIALFLFISCKESNPIFDENKAFDYLLKQCDFGPRNPGSEGYFKCRDFMIAELKKSTDTVITQNFTYTDEKENNLYENTIIIFTSDHGEMMGDHGMLEKRTLYEESARVPMLVKLQNQKSMKRIKGSFSQIDFVPTLLSKLNQELPTNLHGQDRSYAFEELDFGDNEVVVEWNGTGEINDRNLGTEKINELNLNPRRSIIINRIKLNLTLNDSGELFDLNNDPYEEINLIDSPEYQKTIKAMKQKLIEWQIKTEDHFRFD